jgi:hypothetical protein
VSDPQCERPECVIRAAGEGTRRLSPAFHNYDDVFGRRGARIARREEGECPVHLTDEQRSEAGCIGGRDVIVIVKRRTKVGRPKLLSLLEGG